MQFNRDFKHIELHSHLDGSFQAETIFELARKKRVPLPFYDSKGLRNFLEIKEPTDLRNFLKKFDTVMPVVAGDEEAIAKVCDDYIKICAASKICYVEARFSPRILAGDRCNIDSVVRTVLDVFERSGKKHGVVARVILSAMRHMDQSHPNVLDIARMYGKHGVVGIDLAGDEQYSVENNGTRPDIISLFKEAKKEGIHRTVHAGENGPPFMIKEAINEMHAERIGHGYTVLQDEDVYAVLKEKDIHFEVCPSSSFLTGAAKHHHKHPIHRFSKDKVNYSISCDDLMITGRDLAAEYEFCRDKFNISHDEFLRCNMNAAMSSFLDKDDKESLLEHLKK